MSFYSLQVHDVVTPELARTMFVQLKELARDEDEEIPGAFAAFRMFDAYLEPLAGLMSQVVGRELAPVRSYARIYATGNVLRPHSDKLDIPYGMSLCLFRGEQDWPLKVGDQEYVDRIGSGVIYDGSLRHYRRGKCPGEQAQVFFHYAGKP